jgi:hypothetical protein
MGEDLTGANEPFVGRYNEGQSIEIRKDRKPDQKIRLATDRTISMARIKPSFLEKLN